MTDQDRIELCKWLAKIEANTIKHLEVCTEPECERRSIEGLRAARKMRNEVLDEMTRKPWDHPISLHP
jgi:hypothetical protein